MRERLLDKWSATGTDLAEFKNYLNEIANATLPVKVQAKDVKLYSKNEHITPDPGKLPVYVLNPENVWEINDKGNLSLHVGHLSEDKLIYSGAQELLDEYNNSVKLMLNVNDKVYFTSLNLSPTLGLRTDMKGESAVIPSLARDVLTAERLNTTDEITFITRKYEGLKKIYAALSGSYAYVPQNFLCDVVDRVGDASKLGEMACKNWMIDNQIAEIYLEFPQKAEEIKALYEFDDEMTPGLYLAKSDVGECSITIRATWRIKNSLIIADEIKRKHTGKIEIDHILEDVDKIVFGKYTQLPDKLCELMQMDITNPEWTKYSEKRFHSTNLKAVSEAYKTVLKEIGMVSAIGKKQEKSIYEQLCAEINPALCYTAYDVVMAVMQIPERLPGLSNAYQEALSKACSKAPYVKFNKVVEEEVLTMTA